MNGPALTNWDSFSKNTNLCLGLFTYQQESNGSQFNPFGEIDLFESWPRVAGGGGNNGQFTMQRWNVEGNVYGFHIDYGALNTLNVTLTWTKEQIDWVATDKVTGKMLQTWKYTNKPYIPAPSPQLFIHLNLWMINAQGPVDGKIRHVSVSNVTYTPSE